ncbi:hypothetical protein HY251_03900 [bacterium]|nr:hypothetical protein [bacterium]
MQRAQLVIAFLLGVTVALSAALIVTAGKPSFPEAFAQQAQNQDMIAVMGTGDQGKSRDNLFVIDTKEKKLGIYSFTMASGLVLDAVRNLTWDLKYEEYGVQKPGVKDQRDAVRNATGDSGKK